MSASLGDAPLLPEVRLWAALSLLVGALTFAPSDLRAPPLSERRERELFNVYGIDRQRF